MQNSRLDNKCLTKSVKLSPRNLDILCQVEQMWSMLSIFCKSTPVLEKATFTLLFITAMSLKPLGTALPIQVPDPIN